MRSSPPWSPGRATSSPRTSPLPSRAGEKLAFTLPAHRTREHLVVRRGDHDRLESVADLTGGRSRSGCDRRSGTSCSARARDHPDIEIRLVPENTPPRTLLEGVAEGRFDVAAVDVDDAGRVEEEWPALRVVPRPFEGDAVAWAVARRRRTCSKPSTGSSPSSSSRVWRGSSGAATCPRSGAAGCCASSPATTRRLSSCCAASRWASSTSCCASSQGDSSACTSR